LPYAKKEDKAAQMREYRELLKQKAKKDYIEKMKALNEEKIDNMLLEAEVKALHFLLNSLLTDPKYQSKKVREVTPEFKGGLDALPGIIASHRAKAREYMNQEIAKGIPEIEEMVDQTFAEVLKEAQTRLSKAELEKRLTAAYKGLADESQSELEKSLKKFYLI